MGFGEVPILKETLHSKMYQSAKRPSTLIRRRPRHRMNHGSGRDLWPGPLPFLWFNTERTPVIFSCLCERVRRYADHATTYTCSHPAPPQRCQLTLLQEVAIVARECPWRFPQTCCADTMRTHAVTYIRCERCPSEKSEKEDLNSFICRFTVAVGK